MVWKDGCKPISNSIKSRFDNLRTGPKGDGRMKRSRYTEEHVIGILKEQEAGTPVASGTENTFNYPKILVPRG